MGNLFFDFVLNRFVINGRIFKRNSINISFVVKKGLSATASDSLIKLEFTGHESIYEVKEKIDKAVLENAHVPILSFQSENDPVMPYDFGYPLGFAGRLMSDAVYGTHAVYEKAVSLGLRAEHHPCPEARHRLHLDDELQYTPRFYEIRDAMVKFFAEEME